MTAIAQQGRELVVDGLTLAFSSDRATMSLVKTPQTTDPPPPGRVSEPLPNVTNSKSQNSKTDAPPFEDHCSAALEGLQTSLTELYQSANADPEAPQVISREYGLNRNLTWKVSRIMRAEAPHEVFQHLPGAAGLDILLDAFDGHGAARERTQAVRDAITEFEHMVSLHAGDRQTLELMLDSLAPEDAPNEPLEVSRKLAFRGNSGIWGVQAKLRLRAVFLAPNAEDPSQLDIAEVSGLLGVRRFRHGAAWPLFQREKFNDDGSRCETPELPLDPDSADPSSFLIPEFCSKPLPTIRATPTRYGLRFEQVGGELGNCGLVTCVYGSSRRKFAPRYRDELNLHGEFFSPINAPVENLMFDVLVHRDLLAEGFKLKAEVLQADSSSPLFDRRGTALPCPERVRRLGHGKPRVVTPLAPRYGEIVEYVYRELDWDAEDFRGFRFEMKYPPLPCTVVLGYELPERP